MAEQTAAWVLHSLEPGAEADVVRHLSTCPTCRALIHEAEAAAARLGSAVDQVAPPAGLRDRILDAVERTPQVERSRPAAGSSVDPASSVRVGRRIGVAFALVAALAGAGTYRARTHLGPDPRSAWNIQSAQDTREVAAQAVVDAVARSAGPGSEHAFLTPPGQGSAVAAVLVSGSRREVVTSELPANDGNRIYVLWGLPPTGVPQAVGTFDVTPGQPDTQPVGQGGGSGFARYAISLEAGRSAPSAPSKVVASGAVRP